MSRFCGEALTLTRLNESAEGVEICVAPRLAIRLFPTLSPELEQRWLRKWGDWPTAHVFNHPSWFHVVRRSLPTRKSYVMTATVANCDLLFMSVEEASQGLQLAGSPYLDKGSILWDPELTTEQWSQFVQSLLLRFHALRFQEVDALARWATDSTVAEVWSLRKYSSDNPWFAVDAPQLSSKRRHELQRNTRVLERRGSVRFCFKKLTVDDIAIMSANESQSNKVERNRAVLSNAKYRSWFLALTEQFHEHCWIALMLLNEQPIAHYAGVCLKGRLLGLHMAFLKEYAKVSPGSVLIFNILPLLREQGIKEFDYGRGQSAMKAKFAGTGNAPQCSLHYFRKSGAGLLARAHVEVFWGLVAIRRLLRKVGGRRLNLFLDQLSIRR